MDKENSCICTEVDIKWHKLVLAQLEHDLLIQNITNNNLVETLLPINTTCERELYLSVSMKSFYVGNIQDIYYIIHADNENKLLSPVINIMV